MKPFPNPSAWRFAVHRKLWLFVVLGCPFLAAGADMENVQRDFFRGNYAGVVEQAREGLKTEPGSRDWSVLLARSLCAEQERELAS
jgi:hypothetical protein